MQIQTQIPEVTGEYIAGEIIQGIHITDYLSCSYSLYATGYSKIQDTWLKRTLLFLYPLKFTIWVLVREKQQINPHPHLDHNL